MEKVRMLGDMINENYGGVLNFCFRYNFNKTHVNYLINAERVSDKIKQEIFAKAKLKDELSITEGERLEWINTIDSVGGFRRASRIADEPTWYLRASVFGKKFKDNRFNNALKKIYDISIH